MIYIIDYGLNNLFELFKNDWGTLQCKIGETEFERDYNAIASYLNLQIQAIDGKEMEPLMVKTVYDAIQNIKAAANRVDSMKATRTDYRSLLNQISALESKLLEK